MNKKSKIRIIVFSIAAILIIISIGIFLFLQSGKNSDDLADYQKQIAEESNEMTDKLITEIERVTETIGNDEIDTNNDIEKDNAEDAVDPPQDTSEAEDQKSKVKQELKESFYNILLQQKSNAISMIDGLVEQCKNDYISLRKSNKWNIKTKANLVSEYLAKFNAMEKQMDKSFDTLINKMKEQFEAEGIDPTSIIQEYRNEYEKTKEENRNMLMDKAFNEIAN